METIIPANPGIYLLQAQEGFTKYRKFMVLGWVRQDHGGRVDIITHFGTTDLWDPGPRWAMGVWYQTLQTPEGRIEGETGVFEGPDAWLQALRKRFEAAVRMNAKWYHEKGHPLRE